MLRGYISTITKDEIEKCLQNWDSPESKEKMFRSNIALALHISKQYIELPFDIEDIQQVATIALWKAINTYKVEKNVPLSSYAGTCIHNQIGMMIQKGRTSGDFTKIYMGDIIGYKDNKVLTVEDLIVDDTNDWQTKVEYLDYFKYLSNSLNEKELNVIIDYYLYDIDQVTIADKYNFSQSNVAKLLKVAKNKMRRKAMCI